MRPEPMRVPLDAAQPGCRSLPCRGVRPGSTVEKRASFTCCDTGRWGKCVFGGRFLSDPGKPPINAFQ